MIYAQLLLYITGYHYKASSSACSLYLEKVYVAIEDHEDISNVDLVINVGLAGDK